MLGNRLTPVVQVLLILNIGIFLIANLINFEWVYEFMALRYIGSPNFEIYQFITSMFMHHDFLHLLGNMFGLFMFGPLLESVWGPKRFLFYYLICGLGGSFCYMGVNIYENSKIEDKIETYYQNPSPDSYELIVSRQFKGFYKQFPNAYEFNEFPRAYEKYPHDPKLIKESKDIISKLFSFKINTTNVGASGAIFGILLGIGLLFPNLPVMLIFLPIPFKAKYFVIMYGLFELYSAIQNNPEDTVAHIAHLGGMLFGFILIQLWQKDRNNFY